MDTTIKTIAMPPKYTWIGLTDEEIIEKAKSCELWGSDTANDVLEFAASLEAKLKQKNIGSLTTGGVNV